MLDRLSNQGENTMEQRILLIDEVASLLRVAPSSAHRWLGQRRKGIGSFPLPISNKGGKLRWLTRDIELFLESQSTSPPQVISPARQMRQDKKDFQKRQALAAEALQRHRSSSSRRKEKV
jgi:predicted DNA-binding transcriptional regulator AlpA